MIDTHDASRAVRLDLPYQLLQSIRLGHAILEVDQSVGIPAAALPTFAWLRKWFSFPLTVADQAVPRLEAIAIDHATPRTIVASVSRPLILPAAVVERCSSKWRERVDDVLFIGLMTAQRAATLEAWSSREAAFSGTRRKVVIRDSANGRNLPEKAWDDGYYEALGRARFVLCPNGDYVWTYRFFEFILCGAIPVVEASCDVYDGYWYGSLSEPMESWPSTPDVVQHNLQLALERLTVPATELARALEEARSPGYEFAATVAAEFGTSLAVTIQTLIADDEYLLIDSMRAYTLYESFGRPHRIVEDDNGYQGEPEDDRQAVSCLRRLVADGLAWIVVVHDCKWWFELYPQFARLVHTYFHLEAETADAAFLRRSSHAEVAVQ